MAARAAKNSGGHAEVPLQSDEARLLLGADAREDGGRRQASGQLLIVDRLQLRAGHGRLDEQAEGSTRMLRDPVVVAGHDLDANAQPVQPSERVGDVGLDRVCEDQEPGEVEVPLVLRADRFHAGCLSHADGDDPSASRELRVENCPRPG
jgi:hypothetical protein